MNRSRRTYARCVWCSSATHDLLSCRAGTSVSVLPASLSLNNKLAVAQHAALTSAWSCVCTSGSEMLLKLTMYCLRTIRTVFLSLPFACFRFVLITLMIIPTTMCLFTRFLRQTTTFVKIQRNKSIYTAESRHTENTLINTKQIVHYCYSRQCRMMKNHCHFCILILALAHLFANKFSILDCPVFSTPAYCSRIFRSRIFSRPLYHKCKSTAVFHSEVNTPHGLLAGCSTALERCYRPECTAVIALSVRFHRSLGLISV